MAGGDLFRQFIGCEGISGLQDIGNDVGERVWVDSCFYSRYHVGLVREVVIAYGEMKLGVVGVMAEVVAADEADCGDLSLC